MNQFVSSSGAMAPPIDWISEFYPPARQVSTSGQPSFADIFQMQASSISTEAFPSEAAVQSYVTKDRYQESLRSESERHNYHEDEYRSDEYSSANEQSVDSSGDPIKAAEAASAQVSTTQPVDEPEMKTKPIEASAQEDGVAEEKVDVKNGVQDNEVQQVQKILSGILKFQGIQFVQGNEASTDVSKTNTEENVSQVGVKLETGSDTSAMTKQQNKTKAKLTNVVDDSAVGAVKQDKTPTSVAKSTHEEDKTGASFVEAISDATKNANKAQQDNSKKSTKIETSSNGELTQTTFEINKTTGAEKITRTETTSRLAESKSTNAAEQIIRNVDVMIKDGQTSMRLQLQPESLGKIELRLVQSESGVMVAMIPDEASTSSLLESQLSELRNTLASSGIQLTDVWVGQQEQAEKQGWWSPKSQHHKFSSDDATETEDTNSQLSRQINYSLSGYDYLV